MHTKLVFQLCTMHKGIWREYIDHGFDNGQECMHRKHMDVCVMHIQRFKEEGVHGTMG